MRLCAIRYPVLICAAVFALVRPCELWSQPATFYFAELNAAGEYIRLVHRSLDGAESVDPRFDHMVWQPFGLRVHSDTDPGSHGGIREIRGSMPRLDVRGEYQIFSFHSFGSDSSGIAFVGSGGPEILLGSEGDRYRMIDGGASLGPDGRWLGLVVRGSEAEEVVLIELSGGSPRARVVTLPAPAGSIRRESLTLTSSSAYLAVRDEEDGTWVVFRLELEESGDPGAAVEMIAGPFKEMRRYMASSRSAVAFLAGSRGDRLDVFVARDGDAATAVNVTERPGEYVDHGPGHAHMAVSDSGEFVTYNLDMDGEPELFLHRVSTPGADGREQITSDQHFNPYIDQESFVFLARNTLVFTAGHDDQSADVFAVEGTLAEQSISFTGTGGDLSPPFRTTGTLVVHDVFQIGEDRILVAASGYSNGPATSLRLYQTSNAALLDEIAISEVNIPIALAGGQPHLIARESDTRWVLVRVDEGALSVVARSVSGPIRLLLRREEVAYYSIPDMGVVEISSDPEIRVILDAEYASSVLSLRSAAGGLVAVVETSDGAALTLVNQEDGVLEPYPVSAEGTLVAARDLASGMFIRGDASASGSIDIGDAVVTLFHLFLGVELICLDAADANDDGLVETADVVYSLSALFLGGPVFPPPYPWPGFDPTADKLVCPTAP